MCTNGNIKKEKMWINNSYQKSWSKNGVVKNNIQGCTDKYRVKITKSKMEALYIYYNHQTNS